MYLLCWAQNDYYCGFGYHYVCLALYIYIYISAVKGSKFSRDAVPSDDVIEIVSSDDGSESSEEEEEEEGEGEELGAELEEGEEGEASSDMQLSDQEQGQSESAKVKWGDKSLPSIWWKFFLPAHANCLEEQLYARVCVYMYILCVCVCVFISHGCVGVWMTLVQSTHACHCLLACWAACWVACWVAGLVAGWVDHGVGWGDYIR